MYTRYGPGADPGILKGGAEFSSKRGPTQEQFVLQINKTSQQGGGGGGGGLDSLDTPPPPPPGSAPAVLEC